MASSPEKRAKHKEKLDKIRKAHLGRVIEQDGIYKASRMRRGKKSRVVLRKGPQPVWVPISNFIISEIKWINSDVIEVTTNTQIISRSYYNKKFGDPIKHLIETWFVPTTSIGRGFNFFKDKECALDPQTLIATVFSPNYFFKGTNEDSSILWANLLSRDEIPKEEIPLLLMKLPGDCARRLAENLRNKV